MKCRSALLSLNAYRKLIDRGVCVRLFANELPRSFPRDSSATLGMTGNKTLGMTGAGRDRQTTGDHWSPLQKKNVKVYSFHLLHLFSVMLSLPKHLAEA